MPKKDEICESELIHEDLVKKVKSTFPKDEMIFDLADFYKIFARRKGVFTNFKHIFGYNHILKIYTILKQPFVYNG